MAASLSRRIAQNKVAKPGVVMITRTGCPAQPNVGKMRGGGPGRWGTLVTAGVLRHAMQK